MLPLRLRHRVSNFQNHIQSRPSPSRDQTDINLPTDTHTGFTKQFLYRPTVRYISAYRFHLLLPFLTMTTAAARHQPLDSGLLASLLSCQRMLSLVWQALGRKPCMLEWGLGLGLGREEKPNVLCTMCLFSSGIGLKEAVSPWEGRRGCQGGNRRAVLCQRRGCAWLLRGEGGMNANVAGIQGGFSRVAGVVQYHFVLNLTCCAALPW